MAVRVMAMISARNFIFLRPSVLVSGKRYARGGQVMPGGGGPLVTLHKSGIFRPGIGAEFWQEGGIFGKIFSAKRHSFSFRLEMRGVLSYSNYGILCLPHLYMSAYFYIERAFRK